MSKLFPALLPGEPKWSTEESAGLRAFLVTALGQSVLRRLIYSRPAVTERRDRAQRSIQADERAGFESCIAEILQLAEPQPLSPEDRAAQSNT